MFRRGDGHWTAFALGSNDFDVHHTTHPSLYNYILLVRLIKSKDICLIMNLVGQSLGMYQEEGKKKSHRT